jgi:protein-S-isoprenylcysteine O-methyltransferase Ste14
MLHSKDIETHIWTYVKQYFSPRCHHMNRENTHQKAEPITRKDIILTSVYGLCIIVQIILVVLLRDTEKNSFLLVCGFIFLLLFFMCGGLPYYEFKKMGGVPAGKRYMDTTRLVDTGIYSVVRHPQWLSWIMFTIALILFTQHWLSSVLGLLAIALIYIQTYDMDNLLIEKFGDEYEYYMQRVPRMNILLGIIRLYQRKKA